MGIIKTAMMSGAAMYGVKQLAKSQESRQSRASERSVAQSPEQYDPEYRAWLEWRSRQGAGSPSNLSQMGGSRNEEPQRMLTNHDANVDPRYEYVDFERSQPQQAPQYQRIEYRPQRAMGFVEDGPATDQSSHAGNFDINGLVGQGMDLLHSGGKDIKGNHLGKFWNK